MLISIVDMARLSSLAALWPMLPHCLIKSVDSKTHITIKRMYGMKGITKYTFTSSIVLVNFLFDADKFVEPLGAFEFILRIEPRY